MRPRVLSRVVARARRRRIALIVACVTRGRHRAVRSGRASPSNRWHDDTLWRELAPLARRPRGCRIDFGIFLQAADAVRDGRQRPTSIRRDREEASAPYVVPAAPGHRVDPGDGAPGRDPRFVSRRRARVALPDRVRRRRACAARRPGLALLPGRTPLSARRSRSVEYGAVGPLLAAARRSRLALSSRRVAPVDRGARRRDRPQGVPVAASRCGSPLTRRWNGRARRGSIVVALGLVLVPWTAIGFAGLAEYPELLRRLSDIEADDSYSRLSRSLVDSAGFRRRLRAASWSLLVAVGAARSRLPRGAHRAGRRRRPAVAHARARAPASSSRRSSGSTTSCCSWCRSPSRDRGSRRCGSFRSP